MADDDLSDMGFRIRRRRTTKADIVERLKSGERLHMQLTRKARIWWLDNPHTNVSETIILKIIKENAGLISEAGDSLFGLPLNSQTFLTDGDGDEGISDTSAIELEAEPKSSAALSDVFAPDENQMEML